MPIYIEDDNTKVMSLDSESNNTSSSVKTEIQQQKLNHLATEMKSNIKAPPARRSIKLLIMELSGKIYPLEVEPKDTIASIKVKIEIICGISPRRQMLFHASIQLEDKVKISECHVREGSILSLFINPQAI